MTNGLETSVVSVLNRQGQIVGTGFVAGPRLIVTCAHVVVQAGSGPGQTITISFHQGFARKVVWVRAEWWSDKDAFDVAGLELDAGADLPKGVKPLPVVDSTGCADHAFTVFGYAPFGELAGLWAKGQIQGNVVERDGRPLLQLDSQNLAPGMSGAPVWDDVKRAVVGLVTAGTSPNRVTHKHRDLALATPSETLRAVCPILQSTASPSLAPNPFFTGGRIHDPGQFFGRERLVREIRAELAKHSSISLVGESQIGKSSLLFYLYATRAEWLPDVTMAFIDTQRALDESDFCRMVLRPLGVEGETLRDLKTALERRLETRALILFCDEAERLAEQDFSPRLHDLLRSLAQEPNFALCLASQRPLAEVFPPRVGKTSEFYNIFTHKTIGPFTPDEARRFLAARLANTGMTFTASEIDLLLAQSRCHPAHLQALAKELFDERQRIASHNG